ncbi:protein far1-related sequence 5-like [Hordeum vulgare]|nr:protein far1-related sequence 5-like [Hordeum vulgare]
MTSTQRSKSVNRILKKSFVGEKHDLHLFAQQVDNCIQARRVVDHKETVANELEVKITTQFGFEVQLSKVYTRAVYVDFKETLYRSTAFRAEQSSKNPTKYLIHHYNRSSNGRCKQRDQVRCWYHRALSGLRSLAEEVDVLNEEEEATTKIKLAENSKLDNNTNQEEDVEHNAARAIKQETILPPPVSNTRGRKKKKAMQL